MKPTRFALLSLLVATGSLAAHRPPNFDALAAAPAAQPADVRATSRAAGPAGSLVAAQWQGRLDVPSFLWLAGEAGRSSDPGDPPEAVAKQSLFARAATYGLGFSDVAGAYAANVHDTGRGAIVVKFRQRIDGIDVFRDELNVVLGRRHELIAMSGYLASASPANAYRARGVSAQSAASQWVVSQEEAVGAALRDLAPEGDFDPRAMRALPGDGWTTVELPESGDLAPRPARIRRVWFHLPGRLEPAWHLELDLADRTSTGSDVYAYVISAADGTLLYRKNLTEDAGTTYSYRVWADPAGNHRPLNGPQGFGGSPNPTGTLDGFQAPFIAPLLIPLSNIPFSKNDPWLSAAALETNGNNADAYVDLVSPDGFTVARDFRAPLSGPGVFDYTYDVTRQPDAAQTQRYAAVVQLFYTVNYLHDVFYDSGFDEAAGNAQTSNFGRGGLQSDNMRAEAQDYSGRNNANMSTPGDGGRPRMQMFIFDGIAARSLSIDSSIGSGEFTTGTAEFGPQTFDVAADMVTVSPADGCTAISGSLAGKIAFVDRGNCNFIVKAQSAKAAGAIGLVVGNVATSASPTSNTNMACVPSPCDATAPALVPSFQVALADANRLRNALAQGSVQARLRRGQAVDRDGSLDNEVVAHEWMHYMSNRLISNATGLTSVQSRGMGEGWSDFNSMLLAVRAEDTAVPSNAAFNGAYAAGSYVTGGGNNGPRFNGGYYFGIRRVPYSTDMSVDPLSLRHITNGHPITGALVAFGAEGDNNAEVHATGEVWTTMLWECYASLLRDTLGGSPRLTFADAQQRMREYLVASLKITPPDPTFLEARNAVLAAAYARDQTDYQAFWKAFAKRGAGVFAVAGDRYSSTNAGMIENFALGGAVVLTDATLDDSVTSCNANGILDAGESGVIRLTIVNSGNTRLQSTTARITSTDGRLSFENNGAMQLPASDPGQTVSASLKASLPASTAGALQPRIDIAIKDPNLVIALIASSLDVRLNTHDEPKVAAVDDVESVRTSWSVAAAAVGAVAPFPTWSRFALSPAQHVWRSVEPLRVLDSSLITPPLIAGPDGQLTLQWSQRFAFDNTTDAATGAPIYIDGGVVEMSLDDGVTWTDAGINASPGYRTTAIVTGNLNPLEGRRAFAGLSEGWDPQSPSISPFVRTRLDIPLAAGKRARIRFRTGQGASHASFGAGWQIDDVSVSGAVNLPFYGLVGGGGVCGISDTTTTLAPQVTSAPFGSLLNVVAAVTSAGGEAYGGVEFLENGLVVGAQALAGHQATFNAARLAPGTHTIVASFVGSTNFKASLSSPVTVTVTPASRRRSARH